MTEKTLKIVRSSVGKPARCFSCNTYLVPTHRQSRDIFKSQVYPLERRTSDLMADLLDIVIDEKTTHSRFVCLKCYKIVSEFAALESRACEIRSEMTAIYKQNVEESSASMMQLKSPPGRVGKIDEDDSSQETAEVAPNNLDAAKLNHLVAEASGGSLKIKNRVRPKVLVLDDGEYKEISLDNLMEEGEEEGEEEAEEMEESEHEEEDEKPGELMELTKTIDDLHVCQLCPDSEEAFSVSLPQIDLMRCHFEQEHNLKYFFCTICGDAFAKKSELMSHVLDHDSTVKFDCDHCNRTFSNQKLYRIHLKQHAGAPKAWSCDICSKKYSSRNLLDEHMNSHLGVKPYNCDTCNKSFSSKYTYKAHLKIHMTRERNFTCPTCDKSFMSQQNLQQHVKTHSEAKDYVCNTCGKGFGTLRNLEVHNIVHSGLKPFVCRFCSKGFARKAEIKDHERTHTGEKPFICEHCGGQFSQRSNLQSHKRVTHFNDRRYICDCCGKGFKRKRLLDYHVKAAHTGERPFTCDTCEATFVYPEHYKKHIRIHTGIKPFKCEVCDKAFNSRDNRNAHRFVHSDKKPYECVVCGVGFMRKPLLYSHMKAVGHLNDTIVVNQPRMERPEDDQPEEELLIVDESNIRKMINKKVYLTDSNEHVIIQGGEKTLFAKFDDGNLKKLTSVEGSKQLLDEDGNFIDLEDNMISIEELEENSTMMAHFNEKGQLVNEDGQIISEETLIVDDTMGEDDEETMHIKTEDDVQYVQIEVPEGENPREWLKLVKTEALEPM